MVLKKTKMAAKKQSAVKLGVKQTARLGSKRAITSVVNNTVGKGALASILIATMGAVVTQVLKKV